MVNVIASAHNYALRRYQYTLGLCMVCFLCDDDCLGYDTACESILTDSKVVILTGIFLKKIIKYCVQN